MTVTDPGWPADRDPGRQPERTRLAWRRTVLAVTVVVLLAARLGAGAPHLATAGAAVAAVLAGWLAVLVISWRRIRMMAAVQPEPAYWTITLTTFATLGLAGLGLVFIIIS